MKVGKNKPTNAPTTNVKSPKKPALMAATATAATKVARNAISTGMTAHNSLSGRVSKKP